METAKPRILVVEDEAAIRDGLVDVLVYHGYTVDAVGDGRDGLQKALSGQYELLLLDVMLPGRDGFAICDEVRKVDRDLAIIMLTAKTSDEDIVNGLSLGAVLLSAYGVMYLVLREDEYALLAGALISFVTIAATMYATRRVEWSAPVPQAIPAR